MRLALRTAFSAFWRTLEANSSRLAAVSSRLDACSSVRRDKSLLPMAISRAAVLMDSLASRICRIMSRRRSMVPFELSFSSANMPLKSASMVRVRSPSASAFKTPLISRRPCSLVFRTAFSP